MQYIKTATGYIEPEFSTQVSLKEATPFALVKSWLWVNVLMMGMPYRYLEIIKDTCFHLFTPFIWFCFFHYGFKFNNPTFLLITQWIIPGCTLLLNSHLNLTEVRKVISKDTLSAANLYLINPWACLKLKTLHDRREAQIDYLMSIRPEEGMSITQDKFYFKTIQNEKQEYRSTHFKGTSEVPDRLRDSFFKDHYEATQNLLDPDRKFIEF